MPQDGPSAPSTLDKAIYLSSKVKSDVNQLLRRGNDSQNDGTSSESDTASTLFEDAAFNPQMVLEGSPQESKSLRHRLHRSIRGAAITLKNPKRAMRSKYTRAVAGNLSGEPVRYDTKCDEELVEAHDALGKAHDNHVNENSYSSDFAGNEDEKDDYYATSEFEKYDQKSAGGSLEDEKARIRRIEDKKDSLRTAWVLGRHVRRVKAVQMTPVPPRKTDYIQQVEGGDTRVRWERYLAHLMLWYVQGFTAHQIDDFDELPFDLADVSRALERLAIVSTPWQSFLVELRDVYTWKDRRRSFAIMTAYWILWYFQHIMTAAFAWIIFATIRNKLQPTKVETIRKRVRRARDERSRAQAWSELIQRHGRHDWVEPLLDELGPIIQMELGDLSSLLEVLQNFYRWERPQKTIATLFFFAVCLLTSCVADMNFCVKLIWGTIGYMFFFNLPLSSQYPKYRKLFNPINWIFWDIPNSAELSIIELQEKAATKDAVASSKMKQEEQTFETDVSSSGDDMSGSDLSVETAHTHQHRQTRPKNHDLTKNPTHIPSREQLTFRTVNPATHRTGHLTLRRHGIRYHEKHQPQLQTHTYSTLLEMSKLDEHSDATGSTVGDDQSTSTTHKLVKRITRATDAFNDQPSGLKFTFLLPSPPSSPLPCSPPPSLSLGSQRQHDLVLTLSKSDRDKVFNVVIAWSQLRWRPLFSVDVRNHLTPESGSVSKKGKGNQYLDDAVKRVVE